jgi:hypothetical protein
MKQTIKNAGKYRFPKTTRFTPQSSVFKVAQTCGLDTANPESVSSPALTAWYVSQFCVLNSLRGC